MRRLDDARDGRVQPPAPLLQLRGERHFLRQRMLEEILGDRIERLLVDELGVLELLQRFAQLRRVLLDDGCERRLVELASDHRGGLQHVLLALPPADRCAPPAARARSSAPPACRPG